MLHPGMRGWDVEIPIWGRNYPTLPYINEMCVMGGGDSIIDLHIYQGLTSEDIFLYLQSQIGVYCIMLS